MAIKKKIILLLFAAVFQLTAVSIYAQSNRKTDSILKTAANKIYTDPDKVIRIGHQIVASSQDNVDYQIRGYKLISDGYSSKRDYAKSLKYVVMASELVAQSHDKLLEINIANKAAILYHQLKVYDKAIQYLDQAEHLIEAYPNKDSIHIELGKNYILRGFIYKEKLSCSIAIAFLDRGIAQLRKSNKKSETSSKISIALYNKGNCYLLLKKNDLAHANFNEAAQVAREVNARSLEAFALKGSAEVYTLEGKNIEALDALNKALALSSGVNDLILNQAIYKGLAENYLAADQWEQFKIYHEKFIFIQKLMKDRERISVSESLNVKALELGNEQEKLATKFYYSLTFLCLVSMLIILFVCVLINRKRKEIETIKAHIQILQNKKGQSS
jgi:tetratricopeptide (TPR) repeat protein